MGRKALAPTHGDGADTWVCPYGFVRGKRLPGEGELAKGLRRGQGWDRGRQRVEKARGLGRGTIGYNMSGMGNMATKTPVNIGNLIYSRPDMHSGRPCLAGTGMTVHAVAVRHMEGMSAEEIPEEYPHRDLARIHAALATTLPTGSGLRPIWKRMQSSTTNWRRSTHTVGHVKRTASRCFRVRA